jgi:hypothetical protein
VSRLHVSSRKWLLWASLLVSLLATSCRTSSPESDPNADPFDVEVAPPSVPQIGDVVFEPPSGTFMTAQSVSLSILGGSGVIYYTLDGSLPSEASPIYEASFEITATTRIRATRGGESTVSAASYIAVDSELEAFSSNLPIVLLERHGDGPIETESNEQRISSVLFMEPASGRTPLLGRASFASRAGLHVRGASSRNFAQKSYALELWNDGDDEDRKEPVLGMPKESDWTLIAPSEIDRSLMRTMLPFDLSRKIGSYAPRTRFVEVFVVDREGSSHLSASDYQGVYTVAEEVKRDAKRVKVTPLNVADVALPEITGGYIFKLDHDGGPLQGFEWIYPSPEEMALSEWELQVQYLDGYLSEFFTSLREEGFTHPTTGLHYSQYIDVPRWIDHNLLVALTKNVDGLRLSSFFHKDRDGLLVAGPIWDFDRSMGTPYDGRAIDPEEWSQGDGTHPLQEVFWADLFADPEFEARYWRRWDELSQGAFSVEALQQMIDSYEETLREARERHFEHWQQLPPEGGAAGEVQILRDWFAARVPWISSQRPESASNP